MFWTSGTIEDTCLWTFALYAFWFEAELCFDWMTRMLQSDEESVPRTRLYELEFGLFGG